MRRTRKDKDDKIPVDDVMIVAQKSLVALYEIRHYAESPVVHHEEVKVIKKDIRGQQALALFRCRSKLSTGERTHGGGYIADEERRYCWHNNERRQQCFVCWRNANWRVEQTTEAPKQPSDRLPLRLHYCICSTHAHRKLLRLCQKCAHTSHKKQGVESNVTFLQSRHQRSAPSFNITLTDRSKTMNHIMHCC